jgi:Cu-Zn family superoxide dismutase
MRARMGMIVVTCVAATLFWACSPGQETTVSEAASEVETPAVNVTHAVAVLHPTEGNEVSGVVRFERLDAGIRVQLLIEGLEPGDHGFHIHEFGDCSAPDGTSAGGHFNPFDAPHGARDAAMRHVGDLGNVTADEDGIAEDDFVDEVIAFDGEASILARGVIVHADADDLTSQPSGNAGPRVACGVVGIAEGVE